MKRKILLFLIGGMMLLAGCGKNTGEQKGHHAENKNHTVKDNIANKSDKADRDNEKNQNPKTEDTEAPQEGQYVWQEVCVTLPEDWEGRFVTEVEEDGFFIYQKASYNRENGSGYLCGIKRTKEYTNYGTGETLLAYTDDGTIYYFMEPTDVSCDSEDPGILDEYGKMCRKVNEIRSSVKIDAPSLHLDAHEYVLPLSSIARLSEEALLNLSGDSLWVAKNEIYARHGRQFTNEYLRQHFSRCSWYEGTTPPQEFDENCLSPLEESNLKLISDAQQDYKRRNPGYEEGQAGGR